jgi:lysozyme
VNECDWPAARNEIRRWVFGGGRKLPGLVLRRQAESVLL